MGGIEGVCVCVWKECECFPLQISIQLSPLPEKTLRKSPKCWPQEDANLPSGDEEDEETKPEATLLGHLVALNLVKMMGKVMGDKPTATHGMFKHREG